MTFPFVYEKLGYIALNVTDVARSHDWVMAIYGLDEAGQGAGGERYYRTGHDHHSVILYPSKQAGFKRAGWQLESAAEVDKAFASLKTFDPLLNEEIEKDRMVLSLNTMLVTQNVLKNGYSTMDMGRLDNMLKAVVPAFNIPIPSAADVYTDKYLPSAADRKVHPWKLPA